MTEAQIIDMVKRGPGCEVTLADCASLWGTTEEQQVIAQWHEEKDKLERNTRLCQHGVPPVPTMATDKFQELSDYALMARAELKNKMQGWCDNNGVVASENQVNGSYQFFDKETLDDLAKKEEDEEEAA